MLSFRPMHVRHVVTPSTTFRHSTKDSLERTVGRSSVRGMTFRADGDDVSHTDRKIYDHFTISLFGPWGTECAPPRTGINAGVDEHACRGDRAEIWLVRALRLIKRIVKHGCRTCVCGTAAWTWTWGWEGFNFETKWLILAQMTGFYCEGGERKATWGWVIWDEIGNPKVLVQWKGPQISTLEGKCTQLSPFYEFRFMPQLK